MMMAGDARAVERYQRAVEASAAKADGWTVPRIAVRLGVSSTTVRRDLCWLERFQLPRWLNPWEPWKGSLSG
jgi:NADH/NAD ratio-sensing transcriptional regulator Rex